MMLEKVIGLSRCKKSWVHLNEEGKKLYGTIFPDGTMPVLSMIPQVAKTGDETNRVYLIYHEELTEEQVEAVLHLLSRKFGADKELIRHEMITNRLPIREKYVSGAGTENVGLFM